MKKPGTIFLLRFFGVLIVLYMIVAFPWTNDHVIVPFTAGIASVSAWILRAMGESVSVHGTALVSPGFAVNVENGCNGIEAILLLVPAIVAFPASGSARLIGISIGFVLIQLVNLVRVVSLFWIGKYHKALFDLFHVTIWQVVIILITVFIFIAWSRKFGLRKRLAGTP